MAVDFIEELYEEANLLFSLKKMIRQSQRQQSRSVRDVWNEQTEAITSFCKKTALWDVKLGNDLWDSFTVLGNYIGERDSVKTADLLEEMMPRLYRAMELRGQIDVEEGGYRLFSSKSGFLSIESIKNGQTLVSTVDPAMEAYEKASVMCNPGKDFFCTFGCELGYLAWQMFEVSDQSMDIFIYEDDMQKIDYARSYGVLDRIPMDKLHVVVNEDTSKLFDAMVNRHLTIESEMKTAFYIETDSFEKLHGTRRDLAIEILQNLGTELNYISSIERNFYLNYKAVRKTVEDIDRSGLKDEWIVVGGGPSVDYNIDYLKEQKGSRVIIATSTILKRLVNEGIKPDFVIAIDMLSKVYDHIKGLEDIGIPLIISDYANWRFSREYRGDKYLIPTDGKYFSKEIYDAAKVTPLDPSGTVTVAAIRIAIMLGAKKINLVGVDLAFPGNYSHANGAAGNEEVDKKNFLKVPSVNGEMVDTNLIFIAFLSEIERLISANKSVSFYNRSRNGALIKGCR